MRPVSRTTVPRAWLAQALFAAIALGACAQSPDAIAPTPVEEARYGYLTCAEMGHEMRRLNRDLASLSTEQSTKRVNDAVGWLRLLHPAHSARTRDIRSQIALSKGELEAVDGAMARRCPGLRS
jgi:hypothetical protein